MSCRAGFFCPAPSFCGRIVDPFLHAEQQLFVCLSTVPLVLDFRHTRRHGTVELSAHLTLDIQGVCGSDLILCHTQRASWLPGVKGVCGPKHVWHCAFRDSCKKVPRAFGGSRPTFCTQESFKCQILSVVVTTRPLSNVSVKCPGWLWLQTPGFTLHSETLGGAM